MEETLFQMVPFSEVAHNMHIMFGMCIHTGSLTSGYTPLPSVESEETPLLGTCSYRDHQNVQVNKSKPLTLMYLANTKAYIFLVESGLCHRRMFTYCCAAIPFVISVLLVITVTSVYEYRQIGNTEKTAVLKNGNDTIVTVQVNTRNTHKVSLKLAISESQPLNVVNLYSTKCSDLITRSSTKYSSGIFTINRAFLIYLPTYLVSESTIHIHSYVLNVSIITAQIELYVFRGLSDLKTYADHLKESVYKATVYIKGAGVQNTSTIVNYTVPATDYYFVVVDSTAPVYAQFDITVNRNYYDPGDYKQSCEIHDNKVCDLSYPTSFEDTQECVLAHAVYVPGAQWEPADIQITEEPQRNTKTAAIVMSCLGGLCVLSLITTVTFCGFYCLCRRSKRKYSS